MGRGELQQRAITGALWTLLNTVIGVGLGFVVNILLARTLGVVDFGRLAYLSTVIGVLGSIASLGVGIGAIQFGAKAHARGDADGVRNLLSKAQGFRLLVTAPVMTLGVVALVRVDWRMLVLAIVFGIWVSAALGGASDALTIENKTGREAQNAMLVNLLTQVGVVIVAIAVATADSVWVIRIIIGSLGTLAAVPFIDRKYRGAVIRPQLPRKLPKGFWAFALPAGAAGIIGGLVVSRTEVVILTWMSEASAAGIFALAFGLASHLFSPAQSLVGPLIPAISGLHEIDGTAVGRALGRTLRASGVVLGLLLGVGMPAFAALVPLIYGSDFTAVPPVLLALGVSGSLGVLVGPVLAFVQARLQGQRLLWVNLAALLVDLGLAIALIPSIGVWGAVIANMCGIATRLAMLLGGELRALTYPLVTAGRDLMPLLIGVVACWIAWFTARWFGLDPMTTQALLASVGSGVIGLVMTLGLMRITGTGLAPSDGEAIMGALPRRLDRLVAPLLRMVSHRHEP